MKKRAKAYPYGAHDLFHGVIMESTSTSPNLCYYKDNGFRVWLYQANCLELMDNLIGKFPEGKFDMIFADPPYFLSNGGITCHAGRMVKVDKGEWDKSQGPELNHEFNISWLSRCQKLLKPNGTIWVSGTHHIIYSVGYAMQQLGFKILNDIIWEKTNPPPNLSCRYFTHSTEIILWASKDIRAKHYFNYHHMKHMNKGRQMKSVWQLNAAGREEKIYGKHPTQKPVALLERCILASTKENDWILDPFSGSGTTGVAAVRLKRKFVGVELDQNFLALSQKRIQSEIENIESSLKFKGLWKETQPSKN